MSKRKHKNMSVKSKLMNLRTTIARIRTRTRSNKSWGRGIKKSISKRRRRRSNWRSKTNRGRDPQ
jgi:hypothetical protein